MARSIPRALTRASTRAMRREENGRIRERIPGVESVNFCGREGGPLAGPKNISKYKMSQCWEKPQIPHHNIIHEE